METMIPLMIDSVNKKKIPLQKLVDVISTNPAKRFGLYPQKGNIALNGDADLIIIDMDKEYILKNEDMFTKQKITIFEGWKLKGKIEKTIVRGDIVFDKGHFLVKKGFGNFITPNCG